MGIENNENNFFGEKKSYVINYRDKNGRDCVKVWDAIDGNYAKREFSRKFNHSYKVVGVQEISEWVKETSNEVVENALKRIKYLEKEIKEGTLLFA